MDNIQNLIEHKALDILDSYSGANNYILYLKNKKETNKKFYPTRSQSDYILNYFKTKDKIRDFYLSENDFHVKKNTNIIKGQEKILDYSYKKSDVTKITREYHQFLQNFNQEYYFHNPDFDPYGYYLIQKTDSIQ